ncbi:hypothetical protein IMZ29_12510 [Achromobacter sp. GG226]|uniref:hypothetical protein n=1 Tax=Verticiella alkaliphila TaxID=2779529 RepID=UPI001C0AC6FB|nr:hypothetical protein [Verticiella sp. GG226]MBU4611322.1 hypothetical protein [Verticiella sp. GG226]
MAHQPVEPDTPDAPIPVDPDPVPPSPDDVRARPSTIAGSPARDLPGTPGPDASGQRP